MRPMSASMCGSCCNKGICDNLARGRALALPDGITNDPKGVKSSLARSLCVIHGRCSLVEFNRRSPLKMTRRETPISAVMAAQSEACPLKASKTKTNFTVPPTSPEAAQSAPEEAVE